MSKELKGMPIDRFSEAWDKANEYIKDKPDLCIVADIESGYPEVMTIENRDRLVNVFKECIPKTSPSFPKGKIIYFGTGGRPIENNSFEDLFKNKK